MRRKEKKEKRREEMRRKEKKRTVQNWLVHFNIDNLGVAKASF